MDGVIVEEKHAWLVGAALSTCTRICEYILVVRQ